MSITTILEDSPKPMSLANAYEDVERAGLQVNRESVRARIYEAIDSGILARVAKGVYVNGDVLLVQGDGRDLTGIANGSIDSIITDHPYDLKASNNGGNRHFATYDCFRYEQKDFDEKARVLKDGCFLVEFLPEENGDNWEYLASIKAMAEKAGFVYYAKVPWKKVGFVSNCGRKSKNTEDVLMFTKGKARSLRPDAKKDKADPTVRHFMSGANGMLPTSFDFAKPEEMDMQAAKPVELLEAIIEYVTQPHEVVLDQFAGSGSTAMAARNKERRCILYEIDDALCANIRKKFDLQAI